MGSGLTPTQSWPYPLETDTPDVASDLHALALALDVVAKRLSGVASARPTASTIPVGTFFFATDTGILSFCTGAAWIAIEPNLTLLTGVASSRPAAGSPPRIFYATDTKQYSVDNGTVWQIVMAAPPWSSAGAGSGWATATGFPGVQYRIVGDLCYLRGAWENNSGGTITAGSTIITGLPAPANQVLPSCVPNGTTGGYPGLNIAAGGTTAQIEFGSPSLGVVVFDNTFYALT
jgi:hypothetical protein